MGKKEREGERKRERIGENRRRQRREVRDGFSNYDAVVRTPSA